MKKLKNFLIFLFVSIILSIFVFDIAKADTTITTQQFSIVEAYMQATGGTIEDFRNLVMENIEKPSDFDNYNHYIVIMEPGGNNNYRIYFWLSDYFNFAKNTNLLYLRNGPSDVRNSNRYDSGPNSFVFNNDYTEISFNDTWSQSTGYFLWWQNPLNTIILASDLDEIEYSQPTWQTDNFIIGNNTYSLGSYIPLSSLNYYGLEVIDYYVENNVISCHDVPNQIGAASNVSSFTFNIHGVTNALGNHLKGYIDLRSQEFVGIGINSDTFTDISYELTSNNEAEDVSVTYSTEWINLNPSDPAFNYPIYRIHYDIFTEDDIDSYTEILFNVSINRLSGSTFFYFSQSVYIFQWDYLCRGDTVTYGYVNYKDNTTITTDPVIENYFNNLSLPNLRFFNNLNTLLPAGPIDSILVLPLSMLNTIHTTLSGSCTPITLTLPYVNQNIQLKCVNEFYSNIGLGNFLSFVGLIVSVVMLIRYFVFLYNWVDNVIQIGKINLEVWGVDSDSGVKL